MAYDACLLGNLDDGLSCQALLFDLSRSIVNM